MTFFPRGCRIRTDPPRRPPGGPRGVAGASGASGGGIRPAFNSGRATCPTSAAVRPPTSRSGEKGEREVPVGDPPPGTTRPRRDVPSGDPHLRARPRTFGIDGSGGPNFPIGKELRRKRPTATRENVRASGWVRAVPGSVR